MKPDIKDDDCVYIPNAIIDRPSLRVREKLVMVSLIAHYDEYARVSYPSIETICGECRISRPTATKTIKELEERGHIRVDRKPGFLSMYTILTPEFKPMGA